MSDKVTVRFVLPIEKDDGEFRFFEMVRELSASLLGIDIDQDEPRGISAIVRAKSRYFRLNGVSNHNDYHDVVDDCLVVFVAIDEDDELKALIEKDIINGAFRMKGIGDAPSFRLFQENNKYSTLWSDGS